MVASTRAAVAPALVNATIKAGLSFAAGEAALADLVSVQVATLAKGAMQTMLTTKASFATALLLAVGLLTGAGLLAHRVPAAAPPASKEDRRSGSASQASRDARTKIGNGARTDRFGDPLPAGALSRFGTVRFRPGASYVTALAFTPDGKQLLSLANALNVWDVATGKELRHITAAAGPNSSIRSLSASPDGKWAATFESGHLVSDGPIRIWDVATGKKVRELGNGHYEKSCFSPDAKILATTDLHSVVALWNVSTGAMIRSWKPHEIQTRSLAFTSDGKTVMTEGLDAKATRTVRFWKTATARKVGEIRGLASSSLPYHWLRLSPDGKLLAAIAFREATVEEAGGSRANMEVPEARIILHDVASGKKVRELTVPVKQGAFGKPGFRALAFSADGRILAAGGTDEFLYLWDPRTARPVGRLESGPGQAALAFSPNGKSLAVAGGLGAIRVLDVRTGKTIGRGEGPESWLTSTVLSADGRVAATLAGGRAILRWDPRTGRELKALEGHEGDYVTSMRLAGDGRTLFSTGMDKTLRTWDILTGKELRCLQAKGDRSWGSVLAASPDGRLLALNAEHRTVVIVEAETGKEVHKLKGLAPGQIYGAAIGPDGGTVLAWDGNHRAMLWDARTGKHLHDVRAQEAPLQGGDYFACTAALSADGKLLAFGSSNGYVSIRELATGKEVRRIGGLPHGGMVVAFSPDGRALAWSSGMSPAIHLMEVATGKERRRLDGHRSVISSLTFSADGKVLVSGSWDTTALVWDLVGRPGVKRYALSPEELARCWMVLAGDDAVRADEAIHRLAASSDKAVPFLQKRVQPVTTVDEKRLARLLAELDSDQYAVREGAQKELGKLGEAVAPACRKALEGKPSVELRRRLKRVLEKLPQESWDPLPGQLQALRALEALELAATAEARKALTKLAEGMRHAWLTREAKAALQRISPSTCLKKR
jgi:WD40 repeat protein